MITKENIKEVLLSEPFCFVEDAGTFSRHYGTEDGGFDLAYNASYGRFEYPEEVIADRNTTQDEHQQESFVVFLCVAQLFARGYQPRNLVLEGKNYSGNDKGFCDILVVQDNRNNKYKENQYLIIECKTADLALKDDEFRKHWVKTLRNGDQLFRYFNTYRRAHYLCMYAADYPEYTKDGHKEHRFENIYHIISLEDNEEYLQTDSKLRNFKKLREEQGSAEEFFAVWKQTYKQDFNTRGLLEEGIKPFEIGNKSYSLTDLKTVDEYSLEKKYNEFTLILRKHTISSHENAFDKLINLFISKIIDEKYNANELTLLWKGAAYDDYFSLQDRLNELYRTGMKEFFDDDVTFIENKKIDEAFKFLSSKADEGKRTIKKYFRQLKYFNNNPFAFLDVHNEQLFFQNAVILKDVITMLQEIYLTSNTDNQFLGDLFEGYLNKGVHQSEGQFFTPIPIVRFLISSLPIKRLVEECGSAPRAIDYACGAGHFLTEYARQVKMVVDERNKDLAEENKIAITPYFKNIVGIEKDYRLSKVSQVATFMYGMDGIHIHFSDGLADIHDVKDHTFNVLVANPPFAVPGFLETLSEENRSNYKLLEHVSNIEKNKAIETFFVERASQLLASGGIATIILPSSIPDNISSRLNMSTRELILKDFEIISIVRLGPNTFGQTGTSTAALFLRRKSIEPDEAEQVRNRVNEWFRGNTDDDDFYNDRELLNAYIKRMGYNYDDYIALMRGKLTSDFLVTEMIHEYVKALNIHKQGKNSSSTALAAEAKKVRDEAQKYVKSRAYKDLTPTGKDEAITRFTIRFVREIEKEKLYYYLLAANNPQQVLVVKSPDDKKKEKLFLGYEWSDGKGNEGIHYLNTGTFKKSTSDDEDEDDTLRQLKGIEGIRTPMFNPLDLTDDSKINSLIRKNYNGEYFDIDDELSEFVEVYSLVDLLDFSRVEFDKQFKTTAILSYPKLETKYSEKEKLGKVAPFIKDKINVSAIDTATYVSTENMLQNRCGVVPYEGMPNIDKVTAYQKGDILISNIRPYLKKVWMATHDGGCSNDVLVFRNQKPSVVLNEYLYYLLSCDLFFDYMMVGKTGVKMPRGDKKMIPNFEIPLPPKSIQKKIAEECAEVDDSVEKSTIVVSKTRGDICSLADKFFKTSHFVSLGSLCDDPMYGANTPARDGDKENDYRYIRVTDIDDDGKLNDEWKTAAEVESKYILVEGDMLFARSGATAGKTFMYRSEIGKALYAGYLIKFHPNEDRLLPEFLDLLTHSENYKAWSVQTRGGTAQPNINAQQFASFMIPVVGIEKQKEAIKEYGKLRTILFEAIDYIESASTRKQSILDKYLK